MPLRRIDGTEEASGRRSRPIGAVSFNGEGTVSVVCDDFRFALVAGCDAGMGSWVSRAFCSEGEDLCCGFRDEDGFLCDFSESGLETLACFVSSIMMVLDLCQYGRFM